MATVVIMPGGFHPFHAGHLALYQSAQRAFPDAEVYVAATNDTSARPFPFPVKEKLAKLAGVEPGHFVQVKSPFRAEEITAQFDPDQDTLIFVRSEKDSDKPPQAGGVKRDGSPSYLQPLLGARKLEPFSKHAYMAYLPTVEFGPGMTSATQIRTAWPTLDERRKTALVMSLYPRTQGNAKLAATVVRLLDDAIGSTSDVAEGLDEAVGGNYLYHATSAGGLKGMLSSGGIKAAIAPQTATKAQTKLPTVSVTRDWGYASGVNAQAQGQGEIFRDVILVLDRNAVESNFKTLGTSQSGNFKGLAFNPHLQSRPQNTDLMARNIAKAKAKNAEPIAKAGGEFEEAVVVPKGALPLKGTMVGFWINPKSELMRDPSIMNDPRRLDMVRPNQFVKAAQPQAVAESVEFMSDAQFYGEILSVLAAMGAGLATGAYLKARDIVKMYNADRIMRALEGYRVGNISDAERQALTKLIAEFKQAMAQRQGEQALAIAKQIKSIATDQSGMAENQGWAATLETVSANGTVANTSGAGAGMTASYQRRDNQPISEDYLDERRL